MRAVVTVTGTDRTGIIAKVSGLLSEYGVNIQDISQTLLGDQFAMVMIVETKDKDTDFTTLSDGLTRLGEEIGMSVRIQHAAIFDAMHNV